MRRARSGRESSTTVTSSAVILRRRPHPDPLPEGEGTHASAFEAGHDDAADEVAPQAGGSGGVPHHPLSPVITMPRTKYLWKLKKRTIAGRLMTIVVAMSRCVRGS